MSQSANSADTQSARGSWWLKVERAEKHIQDLQVELRRYADSHPYKAVRRVGRPKCKEHPNCAPFTLEITHQPDPLVAIICGDALFNLRSALDHIRAAIVPGQRRSHGGGFPIEYRDLWAKEGRRYVIRDPAARKRFHSAVEGMVPDAVAIIKKVQPYHSGENARLGGLYQLSRLNNADKHRQLIAYAPGVANLAYTVTSPGYPPLRGRVEHPSGRPFTDDGAEITHIHPVSPGSQVDMQVDGTVEIAVKVIEAEGRRQTGFMLVVDILESVAEYIRNDILRPLEPYVRSR